MNTDRLSRNRIVDSFFKSCRHDKSIYPYVPKIIKPMPSGEEPAAPHCEPNALAPGLPATIISLRQSRVWVPACSQWLDEHRSTESQQDCRQLFQKLSTRQVDLPYVPKIIKPMPSGEEPAAPHCEPNALAPDCRRRSSRCGNPVFGFLPARNGLMNTDRLSRNRIVDSFFKSCRHDKSIYPYVPKIIKPMPSGEEPAAPHCEPNAFGTGIAGDDHLAAAIPCLGSCLLAMA